MKDILTRFGYFFYTFSMSNSSTQNSTQRSQDFQSTLQNIKRQPIGRPPQSRKTSQTFKTGQKPKLKLAQPNPHRYQQSKLNPVSPNQHQPVKNPQSKTPENRPNPSLDYQEGNNSTNTKKTKKRSGLLSHLASKFGTQTSEQYTQSKTQTQNRTRGLDYSL